MLKLAGAGALGAGGSVALAACGETQIVEVPVDRVVTQIVENIVTQQVPVTKVVEKIVAKEVAVEVRKEMPVEVQKVVTVEVAPQRPPVTLAAWYNQIEYITRLNTDELVPARDFSRAFPGGAEGMFLSGNMRTYWGAKWTTTKVPDEINAGIVPPYKMPNGTNTNRDATNAYGIHGASNNPEEAWDLLKYMTTEGIVEMYKVGFTAPTRKSHENLAVWLDSLAPWEDPEVHRTAVERYDRVFFHPVRYDEINADFVLPAVDGVMLGEETVQEAMDRIKPGSDELLNEPL